MDKTFAQLEAEYCPPLDPALVSAILYDYDLSDSAGVANAKEVLDSLKEDASVEEAAGFDPSGTGAGEEEAEGRDSSSPPVTSGSTSRGTEVTGVSNDLSALSLDDGFSDIDPFYDQPEDFETLDEGAKVTRLQTVLGDKVSEYSIKHTLRKYHGNWNGAVEDLLSQAFFADEENAKDGVVSAKGIEGFYSESSPQAGRKGRAKSKRQKASAARRSSSVPGLGDASAATSSNKWASASKDINFVATRIGIPVATVSSLYYSSGASVPKTVGALLKASMEESKHAAVDEDTVAIRADDLGKDFPTIAYEYRTTLVRLTYPSTTDARELATALTTKPKTSAVGGLQIVTNYATPSEIASDSDWSAVTRKAKSAAGSRSPSIDGSSALAQRDDFSAARAAAYAKASAAHRRGKSDRLMGGAAAYYSQVGRDYAALSANASAHAADQLAASNSTATQLDLHGIDVLNAVRIAKEKVDDWWAGLGESRINGRTGAGQRQSGYSIVVGRGMHSEGGKSKLRPAVMKMLKSEGWRMEDAGAVIVVKGPLKR